MNGPDSPGFPSGPREHAWRLASAILARWNEGEPADAQAALDQHPELAVFHSVVVELAYDEFFQRVEHGQLVDLDAFCQRFGVHGRSLRDLLVAHSHLRRLPIFESLLPTAGWPVIGGEYQGFQILEQLGRGTFARVYLAREPAIGNRLVVIKVSFTHSDEAQTLGRLDHPNIVQIHFSPPTPTGASIICMPFHGRATLADLLDRCDERGRSVQRIAETLGELNGDTSSQAPQDPGDRQHGTWVDAVLRIGIKLCQALEHAHERQIYHLDLKPSNVLLDADGDPMLLDFNLSYDKDVRTRRLGGTLPYMAPEQIAHTCLQRGGAAPNSRADIFSLGVILWQLLVGKLPFRMPAPSGSPEVQAEELFEQQRDGAVILAELRALDPSLATLLERCLRFEPLERPQSAREVAEQLTRLSNRRSRGRRFARRNARLVKLAAVSVVAALAGVGYAIASRDPFWLREYNAGQVCYQNHDYQQAIEHFDRVIAIGEAPVEALLARGRTRMMTEKWSPALEDFSAALRLHPSGEASAQRGYCYARLGHFASAVRCYQDALTQGVASAELYNNYAYALQQVSEEAEARQWYDQAMQLNGNLQAPLFNLALLDWQAAVASKSRPDEALKFIRRAIEIGPDSGELYYHAAAISVQADRDSSQLEAAVEYLRRAVANGYEPGLIAQDRAFAPLAGRADFRAIISQSPGAEHKRKAVRQIAMF